MSLQSKLRWLAKLERQRADREARRRTTGLFSCENDNTNIVSTLSSDELIKIIKSNSFKKYIRRLREVNYELLNANHHDLFA